MAGTQSDLISNRHVLEGESLVMDTKMVVAPMAGVFEPEDVHEGRIGVGQVIGYIVNASDRVPITSPFEGIIDTVMAWPKERVRKYQTLVALATLQSEIAR